MAPSVRVFITKAIEASPFPSAPNVVACYPQHEDWWNRYHALRTAYGRKHTIDEFEWLYRDDKRLYQTGVLKRLRTIQHSATGRAVFAEVRARPSYSVYILPWDFRPSTEDDPNLLGATETPSIPQTPAERARGIGPPGTTERDARGWYSAKLDERGSVDVFYSDERCKPEEADSVLLHEIVHALRVICGTHHRSKMRRGYLNSEEFYAQTIEMMFRSEKGLAITDYRYHPIDEALVLKDPQARALLTELRYKQPSLFLALAKVDAPYNPIRPIAHELLTIDL